MPIVVGTDLAFFTGATGGSASHCDSFTDWAATPTLVTDFFVQGTGSLGVKMTAATIATLFTITGADGINLTGKIIVIWAADLEVKKLDTIAAGGIRIRIEDTSARYREWFVAGKDTWHGGWTPFVVQANKTPDTGYGDESIGFDVAKVKKVGIVCKHTVTYKITPTFHFDAVRYGTGLTIKGGTSETPANLQSFLDAEVAITAPGSTFGPNWGIISKDRGVIFVQGKLTFGSAVNAAEEETYFKDTDQLIVFPKRPLLSVFYELKFQGSPHAASPTEIYFGDPTTEVGGLVIKAEDVGVPYKITASDINTTKFGFYGCSFFNASTILGQAHSIYKRFSKCIFTNCAEMLPYTGIVDGCNFISSPGRAVKISSNPHYVTNCQFINCQTAVHHDVGGPIDSHAHYDYDKLMFMGGTYHIENSAIAPNFYIDIHRIGGSNPDGAKINNSGDGSTTLLAIGVNLILTGLIVGSDVNILTAGTETERVNVQENPETTYIYSYDYQASDYVDIGAYKSGYIPLYIRGYLLGATDGSLPVAQAIDRYYIE